MLKKLPLVCSSKPQEGIETQINKIYLDCLSHASYILESNGEAAIVDPQRDVDEYLGYLEEKGLRLKYILETHLHADFVSGHIELSKKTGATIVIGENAGVQYEHLGVGENDLLTVGTTKIKVIETPGHTPEGVSYIVQPEGENIPASIFTGDTLFAGDVGRPDLSGDLSGGKYTKEVLGGLLYDTLREKIMTLPDETKVYPAHGAGSSCGKALNDVEYSTIGDEKKNNYALQPMDKEEFIRIVTEDQSDIPQYFTNSVIYNRRGPVMIEDAMYNFQPFSAEEVSMLVRDPDFVIIDTRNSMAYADGHVAPSLNIDLEGRYAELVGRLFPVDRRIIFVCDPGKEHEAAVRALRVGYENVVGYLDGGMKAWKDAEFDIRKVDKTPIATIYEGHDENITILDVRSPGERNIFYIPDSDFSSLVDIPTKYADFPKDQHIVTFCLNGMRATTACSILLNLGFENISILDGDFIPQVTIEEFREILKSDNDVNLIDIRMELEWEHMGIIPGTTLLTQEFLEHELDNQPSEGFLNMFNDQTIFICLSGKRSGEF
ncbi:MAG: MBL fold metallo-hydrolase, partial [Candidatus Kariarchaeaceae archaeon]